MKLDEIAERLRADLTAFTNNTHDAPCLELIRAALDEAGREDRAEIARLEALGKQQWGCAGTHRGTGAADCPRESHHHHDERCIPGQRSEIERLNAKLAEERQTKRTLAGLLVGVEAKLIEAQATLRNDPRHWRFDWWRKAIAAEAKLTAWQAAESLPDCPACAVLDSQDGGKS